MSGGPAVVDSLAGRSVGLPNPLICRYLLSPSERVLAGVGAKGGEVLAAAFTLSSAPLRHTPPMVQAISGLVCCDPSRFKIAPSLGFLLLTRTFALVCACLPCYCYIPCRLTGREWSLKAAVG